MELNSHLKIFPVQFYFKTPSAVSDRTTWLQFPAGAQCLPQACTSLVFSLYHAPYYCELLTVNIVSFLSTIWPAALVLVLTLIVGRSKRNNMIMNDFIQKNRFTLNQPSTQPSMQHTQSTHTHQPTTATLNQELWDGTKRPQNKFKRITLYQYF